MLKLGVHGASLWFHSMVLKTGTTSVSVFACFCRKIIGCWRQWIERQSLNTRTWNRLQAMWLVPWSIWMRNVSNCLVIGHKVQYHWYLSYVCLLPNPTMILSEIHMNVIFLPPQFYKWMLSKDFLYKCYLYISSCSYLSCVPNSSDLVSKIRNIKSYTIESFGAFWERTR
jgi:hypothetical protein